MNVAASGDLLDSTVRKVDTVNIFSIYIYFIFLLSILYFSIVTAGTLSGRLKCCFCKEKIAFKFENFCQFFVVAVVVVVVVVVFVFCLKSKKNAKAS